METGTVELTFPLTTMQQGMLFHHVEQPRSGVDIQQWVARLEGRFNPSAFCKAWGTIFNTHPTLRTRFRWDSTSQPRQEILKEVFTIYKEEDVSSLTAESQEDQLARYLKDDRNRGFNLSEAPLSRIFIFKLADSKWCLVWTFPHILLDGTSFRIVLQDVFQAYQALVSGQEKSILNPLPYADFVTWLQSRHEHHEAGLQFFRQLLQGFKTVNQVTKIPAKNKEPLDLPLDRNFNEQSQPLSLELSESLRGTAGKLGITVNTCVQTAWALVLSDFSGAIDDVVFGVLRAGRQSTVPQAEARVGLFINTIPLRVTIDRAKPLSELLRRVRELDLSMRPHEHTPLVDIQGVSELPGNEALFESILVFNNDRFDGLHELPDGLTRCHFEWIEQTNFPLTLFAYNEDALELKLVWNPAEIEKQIAEGMLTRLRVAIETMAKTPDTTLQTLNLQAPEERAWIAKHNPQNTAFDEQACIHHFFERQCSKTPQATALIHKHEAISYSQLNAKAEDVAIQLQHLGVGPDMPVGLFMERTIDMVAGMLGILKAGGAYVPLDPGYPEQRIQWMLEGCSVILTESALKERLPNHRAELLCTDSISIDSEKPVTSEVTSSNLAYIIHTSGSTGKPKGIMVEHRNASNFFTAMDQVIGTTPGTWLAVTSISFDISVLELLWTLGRGFKVVLQEESSSAALRRAPGDTGEGSDPGMDFGLFFFASDASDNSRDRYRLLLDAARFADTKGFSSVWTPERHFHRFGGLYPNSAVTGAALAAITKTIQIRAGSCVLPLHHPIRVAEEWAVVDNLSAGRVGLSFASGWHANDFILNPDTYADRKQRMFEGIETVKALWRGESIEGKDGQGQTIRVNSFPPSVQKEPPIWITTAGNIDTFRAAGEQGANILTNLLGQSIEELTEKLLAYREARQQAGHSGPGYVSLMLHTFVGTDADTVRKTVRKPFIEYLKTATDLVQKAQWYFPAFRGSKEEGGQQTEDEAFAELTAEESEAMMDHAFERYFQTSGLFGSPEHCREIVQQLKTAGVSEVACLIDFGVATEKVLESLPYLKRLLDLSNPDRSQNESLSIAKQMVNHGVTHLQCTPSLAHVILESPGAKSSIRHLDTVLLGGEALPEKLAEEFLECLPESSRLFNMYGPTETTVWSTVADISKDRRITIGRPIANTRIHLLDSRLNPVPLGTTGELYIGGEGVVRGYFNHIEMTRERFVSLPNSGEKRGYRTGDLARYLPDGRLEFLGRIDDQVKLHGHRIELGEIERALSRIPGIEQAVVIAREDNPGNKQLVAYLQNQTEDSSSTEATAKAQVAYWETIWQEIYEEHNQAPPSPSLAPDFNTAGWICSYTGKALGHEEMKEWVNETCRNIASLKPKRLLEIGSGSGLLLFRLASDCELYTGTDISQTALASTHAECMCRGLDQVELILTSAHKLDGIQSNAYDTVVINSVIQYFPNAAYLEKVLLLALEKLGPGGNLFVGDVRNYDLMSAFHTSLELDRAPEDTQLDAVKNSIEKRSQRESELLLAPAFFEAFAQKHQLAGIAISLKRGRTRNEMNNFRFDVVLRKTGGTPLDTNPIDKQKSGANLSSIQALRSQVLATTGSLKVVGLKNARVAEHVRANQQVQQGELPDLALLKQEIASYAEGAIHPQEVFEIDPDIEVHLTISKTDPSRFDAHFFHTGDPDRRFNIRPLDKHPKWKPLQHYANVPAHNEPGEWSLSELQSRLRKHLPEHMIPSASVFLDSFPLTPNGKVDRKALPIPDVQQKDTKDRAIQGPRNDLEKQIAQVWQEILEVSALGIHDNIFELGANSLMIMMAANRLGHLLEKPVSLKVLFSNPTVERLAASLA